MQAQQPEQRQDPRLATSSGAQCWMGGVTATGLILDLSGGGAFFGPSLHWQDEQFVKRTPFARLVRVGDQILFRYREDWYMPQIEILATLRWTGYSPRHHCHGYGLEFESEPV